MPPQIMNHAEQWNRDLGRLLKSCKEVQTMGCSEVIYDRPEFLGIGQIPIEFSGSKFLPFPTVPSSENSGNQSGGPIGKVDDGHLGVTLQFLQKR